MGLAFEHPRNSFTNLHVGRVQQQVSEGVVVFGGKDVVLGVNDVQAQRAQVLHLYRLPAILPGLQKVPEKRNPTLMDSD